jgi:hypothetical protein
LDCRRPIQATLGLLLVAPLLLWLEGGCGEGGAIFPNKLVTPCYVPPKRCCDEEALPASRGGMEEAQMGAVRGPAASLPVGHGGEGEWSCGALVLGGGSCPRR